MSEPKLTYGLDFRGRLVHVNDVPNGMACQCKCPDCGAELMAKQGSKNTHHFAHINGADCKCARMTALHMLAQQIIKDEKKIRTPFFKDYVEDKSKILYFLSVELEKQFKTEEINRRPDCVGTLQSKKGEDIQVWVEIKVTHKVDEEKTKDIKSQDVICMEVDLSSLMKENYDENSVREALFSTYKNKNWINYPALFRNNEIEKEKKKKEEERQLTQAERKWREEEQKREEEERQTAARQAKERVEITLKIKKWLQEGNEEQTQSLINEIKNNPYRSNDRKYIVYDFLVQRNDFICWINNSPKNKYALNLFYTILFYYYENLKHVDFNEICELIEEYSSKSMISSEEKIRLEELISLKIVYELNNTENEFKKYNNNIEFLKDLRKKYCCDEIFRNDCLKVLSVVYGHIIGSDATNFCELTNEILNTCKSISPIYLSVLDKVPNNASSKSLLDENQLIRLNNFVERGRIKADEDSDNLIKITHYDIFDNKIDINMDGEILSLRYD